MERGLAAMLLPLLLQGYAFAAELRVAVVDAAGKPVEGAALAVYLDVPVASEPQVAVMDQIDEQFVPSLLVIETGSAVDFPNSDAVLHHVYSFSAARTFELPLFGGRAYPPVRFDAPGLVVVGCNIHDHMVGHILVVDTPLHGLTDADGVVTFTDVPAANFRVAAYDPSAQGADAELTTGSLDAGAHRELTVELGTRAEQPSTTGALAWEDY